MAFVIDASGSVGQSNFRRGLTFVEKVIDVYEIDSNQTRVALLTFGSFSNIEFNFNNFSNKTDLMNAVQNIAYGGGSTATAKALNVTRNALFNVTNGARPSVQDVCVVLTDGKSNSNSKTLNAAELLKDAGVYIFTIGIGGSINVKELQDIASSPPEQFFLNVSDYETLQTDDLSQLVSSRVCEGWYCLLLLSIIYP